MITTDSLDYHVLTNAVERTRDLPGAICEIGTRAGGSLRLIIDTLAFKQLPPRPIISVDPYGWIDYAEGDKLVKHDYTNRMRDTCLKDIYGYLSDWFQTPANVVFFILEDHEFFKAFGDGVPIYDRGEKRVYNDYSLAFLDGPHSVQAVRDEVEFFSQRMGPGAAIVCDDVGMYDHDDGVEPLIFEHGFTLLEKTARKASYLKI